MPSRSNSASPVLRQSSSLLGRKEMPQNIKIVCWLTVWFWLLMPVGWSAESAIPQKKKTEQRPNILFFITDDAFKSQMSWLPEGRLENGKPRYYTPRLDEIARQATVLTQQQVASPVCTPSRFNCLTGRYASRAQNQSFLQSKKRDGERPLIGWNTYITSETPNLAKDLKALGYRTGFVGKNHIVEVIGREKPDFKSDPSDPNVQALLKRNSKRQEEALRQAGFDFSASVYENNPSHNGVYALIAHNLDWIAQGACKFLDQHAAQGDEKTPFFLWLASTIPHGPGSPEKSWKADRRITSDGLLEEPLTLLSSPQELATRLSKSGVETLQNAENLLWLDDLFGEVIDKLRETGELENTIIIFFNDHGQVAKGTIYEGGVHGESFLWRSVPFPVGQKSEALVSNVDFTPTILELAGGDPQTKSYDGKSFLPVLESEKDEINDSLYFELGYARGVKNGSWKYINLSYPKWAKQATLEQRKEWLKMHNAKLTQRGIPLYNTDPEAPYSHLQIIPGGGHAEHRTLDKFPGYADRDQLYNLADDPDEQINLAARPEFAEQLSEMKRLLKQYEDRVRGSN